MMILAAAFLPAGDCDLFLLGQEVTVGPAPGEGC
jgi:hypothetical protein